MKKILFSFALIFAVLLVIGSSPRIVVKDAVVELVTEPLTGGGTGFEVIAPSGKKYTLTNRHVCVDAATNAVVDGVNRPLRIIEISKSVDLCLLSEIVSLPALRVSDIPPKIDDLLDVYGFGGLLALTHTQGRFIGALSAVDLITWAGFVPEYTTVSILPGNSGSPVLNRAGNVVGVVFASGEIINWRALIVPLKDIQTFLRPY